MGLWNDKEYNLMSTLIACIDMICGLRKLNKIGHSISCQLSPPPEHFYQPPLRTHASNEAIGMLVCTLSMTVWRNKNLTKQYQCSKSIGHFRTVQERKNKVEAERKICIFLFFYKGNSKVFLSASSLFLHSLIVTYGFMVSLRYKCIWEFAKRSRS